MTILYLENSADTIKMVRETLCVAQSRVGNSSLDNSRKWEHIDRLQRMIDECDRQRPFSLQRQTR